MGKTMSPDRMRTIDAGYGAAGKIGRNPTPFVVAYTLVVVSGMLMGLLFGWIAWG